uniref:Protein-tyrosine sulfotransferase n=1 Tax=Chelonoidis abingdonii TaxID=106734 RepID=A0A8C0JEB3_CHEAB
MKHCYGELQSHDYRTARRLPVDLNRWVRERHNSHESMLGAHSEVRCGEETRIIPRAAMRQACGMTDQVLDAAMQALFLKSYASMAAARYQYKTPSVKISVLPSRLFPNSKFHICLWFATAGFFHSMIQEGNIAGCLEQLRELPYQVTKRPRYYSQVHFLERRRLHHGRLIGNQWRVSFPSEIERSTDQVIKPVNLEALSKWIGHIPGDVLQDMAQIAPMLARLGYDPYANPPSYGNPDPLVINNTQRVSIATVCLEC